jgi:NADH dehydrogenase
VEERLARGQMGFTILQSTCFMEIWLSPALGFDPAHGSVRICGTGQNRVSWISFPDVARAAVAALDNPRAMNTTLKLGGPDALSPAELVRSRRICGQIIAVQHVPEGPCARYGGLRSTSTLDGRADALLRARRRH